MMESNRKGLSGSQALERREAAEARLAGAPTPIAPVTTTSLTTPASEGPRAKPGAHPWLHPAAEWKGLPTATRSRDALSNVSFLMFNFLPFVFKPVPKLQVCSQSIQDRKSSPSKYPSLATSSPAAPQRSLGDISPHGAWRLSIEAEFQQVQVLDE